MKTYKPLPDNLTIKPSSIHGLGLFATEDIKNPFPNMNEICTTHIHLKNTNDLYRIFPGSHINHSKAPNCHLLEKDRTDEYSVYVLYNNKTIKAGEELTLDYTKELCGLTGYEDADFLKEEFKSCLSDIEKYGF